MGTDEKRKQFDPGCAASSRQGSRFYLLKNLVRRVSKSCERQTAGPLNERHPEYIYRRIALNMENIEIKARYPDLDRGKKLAKAAGASYEGVLRQVDTYFIVANGRLKLREINGERSELIYYERAACVGPKPFPAE